MKPLKDDATPSDIEKRDAEVHAAQPKAKRTIILVRHGQYNIQASKDADRHLTALGREQADITGQRLANLVNHMKSKTAKDENGNNVQLDVKVVKSTMLRATQTADIILKHFPDIKDRQAHCDLIREGAPCPPDPPFPEWDPTPSVTK